ncbi:hypothetical protein CXF72_10655 [Psychromonas sp. MB-3u-54]|uniref:hypothetical protein n=1 Tax=Psychromonas sp. MB-3u-54 TaxID=2058319 RepID=UPI000C32E033|nr:hypothetical protein [Psychromonas sp. MB-3u-54]PKH02614.1 hypothetical protein CXF72_10655 [Psychromonas sp. MB-3u-54]
MNFLAFKKGSVKAFYSREMIASGLPKIEELYPAEKIAINGAQGKYKTDNLESREKLFDSKVVVFASAILISMHFRKIEEMENPRE